MQTFCVQKAAAMLSHKTGATVKVGYLKVSFPNTIHLQQVLAIDLNQDTLVYANQLSVGIKLTDLLQNKVTINTFNFNGGVFGLYQNEAGKFNFDFLSKVFASSESKPVTNHANPLEFKIKQFSVVNFRFNFNSKPIGLNLKITTKSLRLKLNQMRLDTLLFNVSDLDAEGTFVDLIFEDKPQVVSQSKNTLLPFLLADEVNLKNCGFTFNDKRSDIYFGSKVQQLHAFVKTIDLNKEIIDLEKVNVNGANVNVALLANASKTNEKHSSVGYTVKAQQATFVNSHFKFDYVNEPSITGFDYNHLFLQKVNAGVNDFVYSSNGIKGLVKHASLKEKCGLEIKKLQTLFAYHSQGLELARLYLQTGQSVITNYLNITYPNLTAVAANANTLGINANFKNTKIAFAECLLLYPTLNNYSPIFKNNVQLTLTGKLKGTLGNLTAQNLHVLSNQNSYLTLNGNVQNIIEPNITHINAHVNPCQITLPDVMAIFGKQNLLQLPALPNYFGGKVNWVGSYTQFITHFNVYTNLDAASGVAKVNLEQGSEAVDVQAQLQKINLGYWTGIKPLGAISGKVDVKASQFFTNQINLQTNLQLSQCLWQNLTYKNLNVTSNIAQGDGWVKVNADDDKLKFNLNSTVNFRNQNITADLQLVLADLFAMKMVNQPMRLALNNQTKLVGFNYATATGQSSFSQMQVATTKKKYKLGTLVLMASQNDNNRHLELQADMVKLNLITTDGYDSMVFKTQQVIGSFFDSSQTLPKYAGATAFTLNIQPHAFLTEVVLPNLTTFNGLMVDAKINYATKQLELNTGFDAITYDGLHLKKMNFDVHTTQDSLVTHLSINKVHWQNYTLPMVNFNFSVFNGAGFSQVKVFDTANVRIHLINSWQFFNNNCLSKFINNEVILNDSVWHLPAQHQIAFSQNQVGFDSVLFQNGQSKFALQSVNLTPDKALDIAFDDFDMSHVSQLVENDTALFRGQLNGSLRVFNTDHFQFVSDLLVDDFSFKSKQIGNVHVLASSNQPNVYKLNVDITHQDNKVEVNGEIVNNQLQLDADIDKFSMHTLDVLAMGKLKDGKGYVTGKLNITGTFSQPALTGAIHFVDASTIITDINSRLKLSNQSIKITHDGAVFDNFLIQDSTNQPLQVNGTIKAVSTSFFEFDLAVTSNHFKVLNTTKNDNEVFYGTLILNSEILVSGNSDLPVVNAKLQVLKGSNLTFVVQQDDVKLDIGADVVTIIDKDTNAFLNITDSLPTQSYITGIDFSASFQVDNQSTLTIILDQASGDKIIARGDANLNFGIDKSGKTTLLGKYVLEDGAYFTSFQKIIKREFLIVKGSAIDWTGDPLSGNINITAVYKVKTNAQDLLSAELAGMSEEERNAYRKLLNYNLNLITSGQILKPELRFNIQLEDKDKNAFGGMVDAKLAAVNNDVNELNKQVFSLLILNKFMPPNLINNSASASNASAMSAASTIARNSVNQILTDQLNALSSKHIKGAELNFNIQANDNYTASGSVEQATEFQVGLKKELFNDKLSVQVGSSINMSQSTTNTSTQYVTGDIIVEYILTEDGKYKLKAFRENNYEGLMDGMLYKTGVGFVLGKDFNKIGEVFKLKQDSVALKPDTIK